MKPESHSALANCQKTHCGHLGASVSGLPVEKYKVLLMRRWFTYAERHNTPRRYLPRHYGFAEFLYFRIILGARSTSSIITRRWSHPFDCLLQLQRVEKRAFVSTLLLGRAIIAGGRKWVSIAARRKKGLRLYSTRALVGGRKWRVFVVIYDTVRQYDLSYQVKT